jgi:hypothetical protein
MDLSRELRSLDSKRPFVRAVGLLLGLPQAIFGLLGIAIGICVIAWVIYNSLWQRSENYTGGFLRFGAGPALVALGLGLLVKAFRRGPPRD